MSKPLARWTIGPVAPDGFDCLTRSIRSFTTHYDVDVVICHNCPLNSLPAELLVYRLVDQRPISGDSRVPAKGVSWKLYPPRLDLNRHEIVIDNDIVFDEPIEQIKHFFRSDCTLLLEDLSRTYGRFEKHVPPHLAINSGVYGLPPAFDLKKYLDFFVHDAWQKNAFGPHDKSETFDEQGLIAFALSNYHEINIIPKTILTNCENNLEDGKAFHFIGLNRRKFHKPYRLYKHLHSKMHL